jgi:hypothetical protein
MARIAVSKVLRSMVLLIGAGWQAASLAREAHVALAGNARETTRLSTDRAPDRSR